MKALSTLAVVVVIGLVGYGLYTQLLSGGQPLTPEAFVADRGPGDIVLDVRTEREFAASHIEGAVNLPVNAADFRERAAELPKATPIYVYCASGVRSGRAAGILEELGYSGVYNVGGMDALAAAGAEVVLPGRE